MPTDTLPNMGRPKKSEPSEPLRVPQSFAKKVRRLALHHGKDPGDWLAEEFGAALDKRHAKMLDDLLREEKS